MDERKAPSLSGQQPKNPGDLTGDLCAVASELSALRSLFENRISAEQSYLTAAEAAHYLRSTKQTVVYLAKRTKQLAFHVVGKSMVFSRTDLDEFMRRIRRAGAHG